MNSFSYWSPTKVVFGADATRLCGSETKAFGGTKAIVFYGRASAAKSGVLDKVTESLSAEGIEYVCIGGVQPNPLAEFAQKAVDEYKDMGFDFVLGVGGGSVIDTAKAVAMGLASPDTPVWDFFSAKEIVNSALSVGAILTIAAAGSETSDSAVLTSQTEGQKRGVRTQCNRPRFAIMDPVLTYSLPPRQTVCGITDIMMHTLDRYFAPDADNTVTDEMAEALLRTVIKYGTVAMEKPNDYKARSELMWAGSLSHNGLTGLGQTLDFAVHQLGHALSAKYNIPHGESLSAMWPAWARYVYADDVPRFAGFARNVWGVAEDCDETAALAGIAETEGYFRGLGMPVTLTEAAGSGAGGDIDELTELCSFGNTRTIGSFRVLDAQAMREIYSKAV